MNNEFKIKGYMTVDFFTNINPKNKFTKYFGDPI